MSSIVVLVGNGLGKCISREVFRLEAAFSAAWSKLSEREKEILKVCLPLNIRGDSPRDEKDLAVLHKVWLGANLITQAAGVEYSKFLSKEGQDFPYLVNYLAFQVAAHFSVAIERKELRDVKKLEIESVNLFAKSLKKQYSKKQIHVLTLNYDRLLYGKLLNRTSLSEASFFDGFISGQFVPNGKLKKKQGWYLHIHGSPLFLIDGEGSIQKLTPEKFKMLKACSFEKWKDELGKNFHFPIILNDQRDKFRWIQSDLLLARYFEIFSEILSESDLVISLGYGAGDNHVNALIQKWLEYDHPGRRLIFCHHKADKEGPRRKGDQTFGGNSSNIILEEYGSLSDWPGIISKHLS